MIIIDYKDARPIYEQIVERFQLLILKGVLEPDSKMPSVRNLAVELSINPNTIQKAYAELERQGFIYTIKGRGNFVSYNSSLLELKKQEIFKELETVLKGADEIGMTETEMVEYIKARGKKHD